MIRSMSISGLGVIERADLEFGTGLTVLTGETGAGKTMVLTSLHLLLGRRADPALVRQGAQRATVDGILEVGADTAERVAELGGEVEDGELIVARTVPAQGRSRAHVGGRPVPAGTLEEVLGPLVTIHGQADQLELRSSQAQREALDALGGAAHAELVDEYARAWRAAVEARRRRDDARRDEAGRTTEIEVLSRAIEEIDALEVTAGEEDDLRAETVRLTNVQDLRDQIGAARAMLAGAGDASGALDLARGAVESLRRASRFDAGLEEIAGRIAQAALDLEAAADDCQLLLGSLNDDPARLAALHERRAALRDLMRGRAADTAELLEWRARAGERLAELTAADTDPEALEDALRRAQAEVLSVGERLSAARRDLAARLSAEVDTELHQLSMPNAHLSVELEARKPGPHGLEDVHLLLQSHPNMAPRPLGQGASGGELSRVMLALEVVLAATGAARTFVFDEVDAGIGGRTATEVGRRLARLGTDSQVIVVTHLAQVAAFATTHLVVERDGANTVVRRVLGEERVDEIARMMGADEDSTAARRHAEALLDGVPVPQSTP